jgi:hypothetical protein
MRTGGGCARMRGKWRMVIAHGTSRFALLSLVACAAHTPEASRAAPASKPARVLRSLPDSSVVEFDVRRFSKCRIEGEIGPRPGPRFKLLQYRSPLVACDIGTEVVECGIADMSTAFRTPILLCESDTKVARRDIGIDACANNPWRRIFLLPDGWSMGSRVLETRARVLSDIHPSTLVQAAMLFETIGLGEPYAIEHSQEADIWRVRSYVGNCSCERPNWDDSYEVKYGYDGPPTSTLQKRVPAPQSRDFSGCSGGL